MPVPVYVRPEAEAKILTVEGSAYIDFPVNRTEIHDTYRNNQAELRKILATIDAVKADADTRIIGVKIKGYASPEGPYANNERLAKGRTQTLKEYVRRQYDFPESLLTTDYEPEDWAGLERFVETSGLNDREAILAAIRSDLAPDAKEWRIKKNYPEAYAYLLANVYPGLRHSDYAVKYEVRAYTDVAEIRRLLRTQPQKLSLQEMYMAAPGDGARQRRICRDVRNCGAHVPRRCDGQPQCRDHGVDARRSEACGRLSVQGRRARRGDLCEGRAGGAGGEVRRGGGTLRASARRWCHRGRARRCGRWQS